jgi:hypothetical protein
MAYLVATGVLLRAFDREAADHKTILQAIRTLLDRGEELAVTVQNLVRVARTCSVRRAVFSSIARRKNRYTYVERARSEFWNVSTRPKDKNGGLELPVETVSRSVKGDILLFCKSRMSPFPPPFK